MKGRSLTFGLLVISLNVLGQGTVNFNNRVTGTVVTHVFGPEPNAPWRSITGNGATYTGALLQGSNYLAQLLAANGADAWPNDLQPASTAPVTFRSSSAGAGFVNPITATLTGVPAALVFLNPHQAHFSAWAGRSSSLSFANGGHDIAIRAGGGGRRDESGGRELDPSPLPSPRSFLAGRGRCCF